MERLKNIHSTNIKNWGIDLSKLKDGVYEGDIYIPKYLRRFRGFEEELGLEINKIKGDLSFGGCKFLTSVSNLPERISMSLDFEGCVSLTSVSNLPRIIGGSLSFDYCISLKRLPKLPEYVGDLSFWNCNSLNFISKMPSVVKGDIYNYDCPILEYMDQDQIRDMYGIRKKTSEKTSGIWRRFFNIFSF